MVTTRSAVISTLDSPVTQLTMCRLRVQLRHEIIGAGLGYAHLRPVTDRQFVRSPDMYDAVDFRSIAAGARDGDTAIDAVDQHLHRSSDFARKPLGTDLRGEF